MRGVAEMKEQDMPAERTGPTTETPATTRDDRAPRPTETLPTGITTDDDTEGQGGKVFAIDESDAEATTGA
jgi:hypothetical protein